MNLDQQSALILDNGLFCHVAIKLAEKFKRVRYWTPYVSAFPKSNATLPGVGLEGIERIIDWEDALDDTDLFVFPDVMFGPLQEMLVKMGKRVWGGRRGENLELNRWGLKKLLVDLDMPVAESHLIEGIAALRRFLQERDNFWVKTSRYRGDFETFKSENYDDVKPRLDQLESDLGMKGEIYQFIVEQNIPAIIEVGYDGFTIDGQFAKTAAYGLEAKDVGYVGICKPYDELPEPVKWVNEKLADYLQQHQYRGFFSTEVRCAQELPSEDPEPFEDFPMLFHRGEKVPGTGFHAFLTDPCARLASPPGEAMIEWFDNWPEIISAGADGDLQEPNPIGKYAVEIMIHSAFADAHWQPIRFPDSIRQWVKLRNCCRIEGIYCAVPQSVGLPEVGGVIAIDDDLAAACQTVLERCAQIHGYFLESQTDALSQVITELNNAQEQGVPFTDDQLPTAQAIEDMQLTQGE